MITVYHASREAFRDLCCMFKTSELVEFATQNKDQYTKVAEVEVDDLDAAYELTNHIHRAWQENVGVKALVESARSTSMGDIMELNGKLFVVDSCGFEEILGDMLGRG